MIKKQEQLQNKKELTPVSLTTGVSLQAALHQIGKAVEAARIRKNLSVREASKRAGVSDVWLSNLEKGNSANVSIKNIWQIAEVLGLQPEILI